MSNHDELVALLPRLRRFASGLAGSNELADDLVQGACEKAITRTRDWGADDHLDRWMFRVIRNLHVDHHRARASGDRHQDALAAVQPVVFDGNGFLERQIRLDEVRAVLAELPEDQRTILLLVCVEGRSYKETARLLGLPIGTVTSRLARGRRRLIGALDEVASDDWVGEAADG